MLSSLNHRKQLADLREFVPAFGDDIAPLFNRRTELFQSLPHTLSVHYILHNAPDTLSHNVQSSGKRPENAACERSASLEVAVRQICQHSFKVLNATFQLGILVGNLLSLIFHLPIDLLQTVESINLLLHQANILPHRH